MEAYAEMLDEKYGAHYDEWAIKILRQCAEQVPEVKWHYRRYDDVMMERMADEILGQDPGPLMFSFRGYIDDCGVQSEISAEFLDNFWDDAIESVVAPARRLVQAVK